ncbi:MAG TPA: hypothetical protein VFS54_05125 [Solirubrobacterales bacterium]|nr:hypothetical protein [Solirubrobacterales bacterium]
MKNLKTFGFAIAVATALMVFAASASATTLTSPAGTTYTGAVKAESILEGLYVYINGKIEQTCDAEFEWKAESHGAAATVNGAVTAFSLSECGLKITLLKPGSSEVHTLSEGSAGAGSLTWNGVEATMPILGLDCVYELEKPYVAIIKGSKNAGGKTSLVDFEAHWRYLKGSPFCPKTMEWKSYFQVTSPDYLDVD